MSETDGSTAGMERCDLCRKETSGPRPVCVVGRSKIPLLCSQCTLEMDFAGRIDQERDADVFGYSAEEIQERTS